MEDLLSYGKEESGLRRDSMNKEDISDILQLMIVIVTLVVGYIVFDFPMNGFIFIYMFGGILFYYLVIVRPSQNSKNKEIEINNP